MFIIEFTLTTFAEEIICTNGLLWQVLNITSSIIEQLKIK